jgi:esterase/lipase superfamily enzyme
LKYAPKKDVFLYVHGFNNTFEDAVFRLGMMWHMSGRAGVPIAYTWPAGRGGLTGYAYDRESGEFTIFHLKKFIKAVAASPDVERIHLIAHSRGTDVVCTALRELNIEIRSKNLRTQEQLKLENLVLAAPDMDADVFEQRFAIEDLHLVARRTTVYLSSTDVALALSDWLFDSKARMGNLTTEKFTEDAKKKLSQLKNFWFIDCKVKGYSSSHDYAFAHPAVLSDLILLLRDDKDPGAENGRPMKQRFTSVWEIDNDYLRNTAPVLTTQPAAPTTAPATQP